MYIHSVVNYEMVKIIKQFRFGAFTRDSAIQCINMIKSKSFIHVHVELALLCVTLYLNKLKN